MLFPNWLLGTSRITGVKSEGVAAAEVAKDDLVISFDERYQRIMIRWNSYAIAIGLDADQAERLADVLRAKAEVMRRNSTDA